MQTGFKQVGQRVNIDGDGNLLLRPTYFELSVVRRGAIVEHHLCASYALSFAAVFKAQVRERLQVVAGQVWLASGRQAGGWSLSLSSI